MNIGLSATPGATATRVTRYHDIDRGDRYGVSIWEIGVSMWANEMGDDSIDMVVLHIDMGYLVTQTATAIHACHVT